MVVFIRSFVYIRGETSYLRSVRTNVRTAREKKSDVLREHLRHRVEWNGIIREERKGERKEREKGGGSGGYRKEDSENPLLTLKRGRVSIGRRFSSLLGRLLNLRFLFPCNPFNFDYFTVFVRGHFRVYRLFINCIVKNSVDRFLEIRQIVSWIIALIVLYGFAMICHVQISKLCKNN